jgi:(1->4)-alpha-D-glucan 1-alpha-D-glucosylmutase
MTVLSTYRLQLHKHFTFADVEAIVPYLADLGISHVYASPVTTAQPGSTHGYDVVDPTRINPELGGEEGFRSLVGVLKTHGLGLIIDIVPNHMGVAGHSNWWWQHVLANGQASGYAHFFDISWSRKLLLPFLGAPLPQAIADGALELRRDESGPAIWAYGTHRFPLRPEDQQVERVPLAELLARQHYELAWWRAANDNLHWRRFFTITELAGLRVEDPEVFEETHKLYFRLWHEGLIDGVRIDHVDGLSDPATYLERLRAQLGSPPFKEDEGGAPQHLNPLPGSEGRKAYIVVEKILAPDEEMPRDWPVEGTSGYDFMEEVSALLHDPAGEAALARHWAKISCRPADFEAEELEARRDMLAWEFEGQLTACVEAFSALAASAKETAAFTSGMLRRAVRTMLWVFPVYRTYGPDAPPEDAKVRAKVRERAAEYAPPGEMEVIDAMLAWLAGEAPGERPLLAEAVRRFQQLSAPIAAKAVEDTAFYRYGRLLSRNDVGFDPGRFAIDVGEYHCRMERRARDWPRAMLATATHDHKRGEDVRARLAALSGMAEEWIEATERWGAQAGLGGLDPGDVYMLWQMLVGAWPERLDGFEERIGVWQEKALREAKLRSSWTAPNADYEGKARRFLASIFADVLLVADISAFVARIRVAGQANALVQAFLRCTAPGVPDLYQGAEFEDLSTVDPDNRRPVDYGARRRALDGGGAGFAARKQAVIARLLRLRGEMPALFIESGWDGIQVEGARSAHVLAFVRRGGGQTLEGAAAIRCGGVSGADWWDDTRLAFPSGVRKASELFAEAPIWWSAG